MHSLCLATVIFSPDFHFLLPLVMSFGDQLTVPFPRFFRKGRGWSCSLKAYRT